MYKVELYMDNTYQVVLYTYTYTKELTIDIGYNNWKICFQGTIIECNTWLQLHDKGYL